MRLLIFILFFLLLALQYRLWTGQGSYAEVTRLKRAIAEQKLELKKSRVRNRELQAEINDLKNGLEAVEERARQDLGMIRQGETYFQIVEPEHE